MCRINGKSILLFLSCLILAVACSPIMPNGNNLWSNRTGTGRIERTPEYSLSLGNTTLKVMWIGDSILAGRGANSRYLLWNKLLDSGYSNIDFVGNNHEQSYEGDFDRDNETYGGKKTNQVRDLATPAIAQHKPDFAFIHLGTNDRWEKPPDQAANTAQEIGEIIDKPQQSNPSVKVFVLKFVHLDSRWQRELAAAIDTLVTQKNTERSPVQALDLISVWNAATDTYDGTHANLSGQIKIANLLFDAVVTYLGTPGQGRVGPAIAEPPNIALQKTVTASSQWDGLFPAQKKDNFGPKGPGETFAKAANATDGDLFTSWIASNSKGDHQLMVDLGKSHHLTGSAIYWESAGEEYSYTIEVSEDGRNWTTVVDKTQQPSLAKALIGDRDHFTTTGRYIRVNKMNPNNPWWSDIKIGIREFRVFNSKTETVTANPKWAWDY